MRLIIDIPEKLVCEGFERLFTEEEKNILIKAIGNGTPLPTDAVDRVTIKEYLESFGTAYKLGKENGLDIALDILGKYTEEGSDKIIRDLPSVTPQPCEDCVSRRAVFEILNDAYFLKIDDGAALQESVRQLPPVTPQPKMGRWIEHIHNGTHYIECSKCSSWFLRMYLTRNSYCPNCGAKMQGVEG